MGNNSKILKYERMLETLKFFIESNGKDVRTTSEHTPASKTTVQRYLHDPMLEDIGKELGVPNIKEIVKVFLERNTVIGNKKGGDHYAENYESVKDGIGRFTDVHRKK